MKRWSYIIPQASKTTFCIDNPKIPWQIIQSCIWISISVETLGPKPLSVYNLVYLWHRSQFPELLFFFFLSSFFKIKVLKYYFAVLAVRAGKSGTADFLEGSVFLPGTGQLTTFWRHLSSSSETQLPHI